MKKISISIQKGGNGKTVIALNLARAIIEVDPTAKVLIVDTDPQTNASQTCLATQYLPTTSVKNVIDGDFRTDFIVSSHFHRNIFVLPASPELSLTEYKAVQGDQNNANAMQLRRYLETDAINNTFDYCIIDTPSTLGFLMATVLKASDYILIPVKLDTYSFSVLPTFLTAVSDTQTYLKAQGITSADGDGKPEVLGILPSVTDMRLSESKVWYNEFLNIYKELFWADAMINKNAPTSAALAVNKTIFDYEKSARNVEQFKTLAKKVLKRVK